MNLEPLIELNSSEVNDFKNLREETIKQLEIVREDLGRYYNLLDYAIGEPSFIDFSGITRSIINRGRIIKDLDKKIEELNIIIEEETLTYNSIYYAFYAVF